MKKMVLVDDYLEFAENLKEFIERFNDAQCVTFSNPIHALSYISKNKNIDIVITDYQMPQMNGLELAQRLIEQNLKIRIIVCSGEDKATLEKYCEKYNLDGKVEITTKGNMEFMKNLT